MKCFSRWVLPANSDLLTVPHLARMAQALDRVAAGEIQHLMILSPPRSGRTSVAAAFLAYYQAHYPDHGLRYDTDCLARGQQVHRRARRILRDVAGAAADRITTGTPHTHPQSSFGLSVIDQPLTPAQARDFEHQNQLLNYYYDNLLSRHDPGGAIVLMDTRYGESDPADLLLGAVDNKPWHVLFLPAIQPEAPPSYFPANCTIEMDDRAPGEALWPEKWSATRLARLRATIGESAWSALYQLDPTA